MHFIRPQSYCLFLLIIACLYSLPTGARAQAPSSQDEPVQPDPAPRIESDAERNAFIFIIDGEEIARLDKSGFYVRDSIAFGGTITDTGSGWVDDYIASNNPDDQQAGGTYAE